MTGTSDNGFPKINCLLRGDGRRIVQNIKKYKNGIYSRFTSAPAYKYILMSADWRVMLMLLLPIGGKEYIITS